MDLGGKKMPTAVVKNPTYLFTVCATYLIIFSSLMFLINGTALVFSVSEFILYLTVSFVVGFAVSLALAAAAGAGILGSGSPEAGRYVWKGEAFALTSGFLLYFINKLSSLIPSTMPPVISFFLVAPAAIPLLWILVERVVLGATS